MMACETLPCMSYMALYVFSVHVLNTNSRASTHWKLDPAVNRVIQMTEEMESDREIEVDSASDGMPVVDISTSQKSPTEDASLSNNNDDDDDENGHVDAVLSILTAPLRVDEDGVWIVRTKEVCATCDKPHRTSRSNSDKSHTTTSSGRVGKKILSKTVVTASKNSKSSKKGTNNAVSKSTSSGVTLDCGKTVNYTHLDHLPGISNRHSHPKIPEPEIGVVFNMKTMRAGELDIFQLEQTLRKQKKQKPKSANVYNQIGNLLRIKGETRKSIECYRKAIYLSPTDSEAILNLARVLFNLQYLDDAIYLVKQSLELQPIGDDTWLHYFTLGEILKAYGYYQDAILHFKHALDLNPDFQLAEIQLKELESWSESTVTIYTFLIIVFLVLTVLFFILSTMEAKAEVSEMLKPHRHFSRAMAMKSIRSQNGSRGNHVKKNHS